MCDKWGDGVSEVLSHGEGLSLQGKRVIRGVPLGKLGRYLGERPHTGKLGGGGEVKVSKGRGRGLGAGVSAGKK